jgi:phosphate transport system protein
MALHDHIVRSFTEELEALSAAVSQMGGLAEEAVVNAIATIMRRDAALAQQVIQRDVQLDELQRDIERRITRLLALRQPMAKDLRMTIGALKLAADLERIGDLAKNIAKRSLGMDEALPASVLRGIERMGKLAASELKQVLDSYGSGTVAGAISVWMQDQELDEHYNSLFRELLTYMMEDPRKIGPTTHLLFIAKNLERIGDHCTNMAEVVHYLETGEDIGPERPKSEGLPEMPAGPAGNPAESGES